MVARCTDVQSDRGPPCLAFEGEMGCRQAAAGGQVHRQADGAREWREAWSRTPCQENRREVMARPVQGCQVAMGLCILSTWLGQSTTR